MANLAQLVNAIAPIVTTPALAVVQPIYYPFLLHSSGHLELAVDAHVTGETVPAPAEHLSRSRSASTTSLPSPSSTPRRPSTRSASGSP
jgi:alpha-L-arabinofuranosidase